MLLEHLAWPQVRELDVEKKIVLLPCGAFEQHGPHLPFTTDSDIVTAITRSVEEKRTERIICLPTLWVGHSTHHLAFPGTLSIRQSCYMELIGEFCRCIAGMGARKIFLLNGHGGNDVPIRAALREVKSDLQDRAGMHFVYASYWMLGARTIKEIRESDLGGLGHACEMETSLMLHLHPERVQMDLARRDGPKHSSQYRKADMQYARPVYFVNEFHEISESGVVGHPDLASAGKGEKFFNGIVADVVAFIDDFLDW